MKDHDKELEYIDLDYEPSSDKKTSGRTGRKKKNQNSGRKAASSGTRRGKGEPGEASKKQYRNRELALVTYAFVGFFVCLIGYMTYFTVFKASDIINSPYNLRQDSFAAQIVRGEILSKDGDVLAETVTDSEGNESRNYPYGRLFSHVVGYSQKGKTGIESIGNFSLLTSNAFIGEQIINEFQEQKNIGDNLVTTLDVDLQKAAYDALGDYDGAVVVMEPDTGKVLAMVSKPDYDPNTILEDWESIISDESSSVLLNRAVQGLYPPGSTFKIVTLLEYIRENGDYKNYTFDCEGHFEEDGTTINCYHGRVHGEQDLMESFENSCNGSFANIGMKLNFQKFQSLCEEMLFNQSLPLGIPYRKSQFSLSAQSDTSEIMMTAIGQGKTLVTPLHMAMIVSAVANGGRAMEPYFIDHTENYQGNVIKKYLPKSFRQLMTTEEAQLLSEYMENVVLNGTASKIKGQSYTVAGKTGSAEFDSSKESSHSWFVGFSNVEDPDIVVSVIAEAGGAGSETAVPIAKKIFDAYYKK